MLQSLKYLVGSHRQHYIIALIWGMFTALTTSLVNPLILKYLFDEATIKGNFSGFLTIALTALIMFMIWSLLEWAHTLYVEKLANKMQASTALHLIDCYYQTSYLNILKNGEGYYVSRLHDEVVFAIKTTIDLSLGFSKSVASLIGGLIAITFISIELSFLLFPIVILLILVSRHHSRQISNATSAYHERTAQLKTMATNMVKSFKAMRLLQLQKTVLPVYQQQYHHSLQTSYHLKKVSANYTTLASMLMSAIEIGMMILAGYFILLGKITFGGFMGFVNAFWISVNSFKSLVDQWPQLASLQETVKRLQEFEHPQRINPHLLTTQKGGSLQAQQISFGFNDQQVLNQLDFTLQEGERVILRGANGTGKSTLACLAAGLLSPSQGHLQIPQSVSAMIEPLDLPPLPIGQLIYALDPKKKADQMIQELGIQEILNQEFSSLSLGQKKKVLLILGLLKTSDFYIFDEPLANIDLASQSKMMDFILKHTQNKTLLVILHGSEEYESLFDRVVYLGTPTGNKMTKAQKRPVDPFPAQMALD